MNVSTTTMNDPEECDAKCAQDCPHCKSRGSVECWQCGSRNIRVDEKEVRAECLDCGCWEEADWNGFYEGYRLGKCEVRLVTALHATRCSHTCQACGGSWQVCKLLGTSIRRDGKERFFEGIRLPKATTTVHR